jgi:regulatory protein
MALKKNLTPGQALQKLKHFCAYQERCHNEVREKLYDLGVWKKDHDEIIATLIEEKYLDEERFAIAFAGGKFRIKKWGRQKIRHALRQKQVSEYSIRRALGEIDEEAYENMAFELLADKYADLKQEQYLVRKKKSMDYMVARGYEYELLSRLMSRITGKQT